MAVAASSDEHVKIGEVARQSGLGVETLRFYESRGLIEPIARTDTGYRLYDAHILSRLSFIKKAQSIGFSLDEIAHIISDAKNGTQPCEDVRRLASEKLVALDLRIRQLQQYRKDLRKTVTAWESQPEADGEVCGLIEGLAEPPRRSQRRRL
jgi:MerR family copper efflux transcriptional regulator